MEQVTLKSQRPYSPGLEGIVAGISEISEIDPKTEHLTYRGFDIHDLARYSTYEEAAYLLLMGSLPRKDELKDFSDALIRERDLPRVLIEAARLFPAQAHPMDVLRTGISMLAMFDPDLADLSREANLRKAMRLAAKFPTFIAVAYRLSKQWEMIGPNPKFGHAKNFLYMLTGKEPDENSARVFDQTLILYAEHGFNASTFSARVTASTLSDFYSAITSALGTLKGSLHGGANEEAMKMLLEIREPTCARRWIEKALAEKKRVMGFGHREYKKGDPRARILMPLEKELGERVGQTQWYEISKILEEAMLREKGLYPNVDFPSGAVFYMLGLPIELFTPIFAMSRISGWSSHVIEQLDHNRLIRPECEYTGPRDREYIPIESR